MAVPHLPLFARKEKFPHYAGILLELDEKSLPFRSRFAPNQALTSEMQNMPSYLLIAISDGPRRGYGLRLQRIAFGHYGKGSNVRPRT
jgi:hypothetical protein